MTPGRSWATPTSLPCADPGCPTPGSQPGRNRPRWGEPPGRGPWDQARTRWPTPVRASRLVWWPGQKLHLRAVRATPYQGAARVRARPAISARDWAASTGIRRHRRVHAHHHTDSRKARRCSGFTAPTGLAHWYPQRDSNPCRHLDRVVATPVAADVSGVRQRSSPGTKRRIGEEVSKKSLSGALRCRLVLRGCQHIAYAGVRIVSAEPIDRPDKAATTAASNGCEYGPVKPGHSVRQIR